MLTTIRLQPLRELISSPPYFFRNLFSPWALAFLLGAVFFRSLFSPLAFSNPAVNSCQPRTFSPGKRVFKPARTLGYID
jgi:hypothetical protein